MAVRQACLYAAQLAKTMRDSEGSIEPVARLFSHLADLRDTGRPRVHYR